MLEAVLTTHEAMVLAKYPDVISKRYSFAVAQILVVSEVCVTFILYVISHSQR